jgi:hypothetical protein
MASDLTPEQLDYLQARGIPADRAQGLYQRDGSDLLIPYRDPQGQPYVIRSSDKLADGKPYIVRRPFPQQVPKFRTPPKGGNRPYFSPLMPPAALSDTSWPLVVVEGPIKCDALWLAIPTGYCFIALGGVWNFRDRRDSSGVWQEHGKEGSYLAELKAVPMAGRRILVLYDSDIADNPGVAEAARKFGYWVKTRGAQPYRPVLPAEPDGRKNGADDFVVRHGAAALIERLEAARCMGWPVRASLLTRDGDIRSDYDATEEQELFEDLAQVSDITLLDAVVRRIAQKTSLRNAPEILARVADVKDGSSERGILCSDEELDQPDMDSRWIVPDIIPRGDVVILAGDSGAGKSYLAYELCRALAQGSSFLGFSVPKMRVLILQLEEGPSGANRLKAMGFHSWGSRGAEWEISTSFDFAKPSHRQQLTQLIRSGYGFVFVDPLRSVCSLGIPEETSDFGKLVLRPLRNLIVEAGGTALINHHLNKSGIFSGHNDIKAAVWGLFVLRDIEGTPDQFHLSSLKEHGGKVRDGAPVLWRLDRQQVLDEGDRWCGFSWKLLAMEQKDAPDLPLVQRVFAYLATQPVPVTLRQIGEALSLPLGKDGKVNPTLRSMASQSAALRQWRDENGENVTHYFVPHDRRPASVQQSTTTPIPPPPLLPLNTHNHLTLTDTTRDIGVKEGATDGLGQGEASEVGLSETWVKRGTPLPPPEVEGLANQDPQTTSLPADAVHEVEPPRAEPRPQPPGLSLDELLVRGRVRRQANQPTTQPNHQPEDRHYPKPPRASAEARLDQPQANPVAAFIGAELLGDAHWWNSPWEPPTAVPISQRYLSDPEAAPGPLQELL